MAIRDFFKEGASKAKSIQTKDSLFELEGVEIESSDYALERSKKTSRYIPDINFLSASNFARYGSAEEYYRSSFQRIYQQYPYDGTKEEIVQFDNESTYLDKYIFDNIYPKTTGYVIFAPTDAGWGSQGAEIAGWGTPSSNEYISFKGGPHTSSGGATGEELRKSFEDPIFRTSPNANTYDTDIYFTEGVKSSGRQGTRESNLLFDLSRGVSTEFWLRKGDWVTSLTEKEVIFDLWNGNPSSSTEYGRLLVYVTGAGPATTGQDPFRVHIASGSNVWDMSFGGTTTTTASLANTWKHVGFTFFSSSVDKDLQAKFYLDGNLQDTTASSHVVNFGNVTGSMIGHIGALQTAPSGNNGAYEAIPVGAAKLSGSIDEFRYWKTKRSSKDIGRNWFTQVGGGTNDSISNAELGIYFKFNEGITGRSTTDSAVLDYSGRISNGVWTGYTVGARNTGSAMVSASASPFEFLDPIIYSSHPDVDAELTRHLATGSSWDVQNNSLLYHSLPHFMLDAEEEQKDKHLKNLTQIMGSYFDELHLQIESLSGLASQTYASASAKPNVLAKKLLESKGFVTPDIFTDIDSLAAISNRDENRDFEVELADVKNQIYQNIYNNLIAINKSKGTEKSFRNLIHCWGADEELVRFNMYSNNGTYPLLKNYRYKSVKKKFANFSTYQNSSASVYQHSTSVNPNTTNVTFISGTNAALANTAQIEVIFPKQSTATDGNQSYNPFLSLTSSIFGCHSASVDPGSFTWAAAANDHNFELYAVRPEMGSSDAYFLLKDRAGNFSMTSSVYGDVYDNQRWNFAVRIKDQKFPIGDFVSGSLNSQPTLDNRLQSSSVEFVGINAISDVIANEFTLTSDVTSSYLTGDRRYYVGAHLLNFTGAVSASSDVKATSLRHWASYLEDEVLRTHARDPDNYGSFNPIRSAYGKHSVLDGMHVPAEDTLSLHWDFSTVSSSNASGIFTVDDFSSGSIDQRTRYPGTFGEIVGNQYGGRSINFPANNTDVVKSEYLSAVRQKLPESMAGTDTVTSLTNHEITYSRDIPPDDYYFTFEKSLYQTISEEMLNMFGTIVEFNNMIGSPVQKYRQGYKDLDKLRNLFFEKVQNTPDVEKYLEYYKWVDSSLSEMLRQLIPASANMSDSILNVVESHILERSKYRHKFPTVKQIESTEASIMGYAENTYPWRTGHAPVDATENENCFWWKERAERDNSTITSGDSNVDAQRNELRKIGVYQISGSTLQVGTDAGIGYRTSGYASRALPKIYNFSAEIVEKIHNGNVSFISPDKSYYKGAIQFGKTTGLELTDVQSEKNCDDVTGTPAELKKQRKNFTVAGQYKENKAPFLIISSSVDTGYAANLASDFMAGVDIANNHEDVVIEGASAPMQGFFPERFVGGNPHRHADFNFSGSSKTGKNNLDSADDRIEAYDLDMSTANQLTIMHPDANRPRSSYLRSETAKRPVNIRNIKMITGSSPAVTEEVSGTLQASLGNFSKFYEVVQAGDRATNNRHLTKYGIGSSSAPSAFFGSVDDFEIPTREKTEHTIVERFSAPGGVESTILDLESGQYSPYNDMNSRNSGVRSALRGVLSEKSERFGIRSGSSEVSADYSVPGSFHKVNKNPLPREEYIDHLIGTGYSATSSHDNYYVQHQIPRSDVQYAWVTSSYASSYVYGHAAPDGKHSGSEGVTPAILFTSASSDAISGIHVDHVGLNTIINEPVSSSDARLGYPLSTDVAAYKNTDIATVDTPQTLNSILLHRGGIYGFNSWSQLRNADNPIVRDWKKNNTIAFNTEPGQTIIKEDGSHEVKKERFSPLQSFKEPPVTSINYPLTFVLDVAVGKDNKVSEINATLGNEDGVFTNSKLNSALNPIERKRNAYDKVKGLYLDGALDSEKSPVVGFRSLSYKQVVYPKAENSYFSKTRSRPGYANNFWRTTRADRDTLGDSKFSFDDRIDDDQDSLYSSWNMDADVDFVTKITGATAGILQNNKTHFHNGQEFKVSASICFHNAHSLEASASVKALTGAPVPETGAFAGQPATTMPQGKIEVGGGNALWEVGDQARFTNLNGETTSDLSYPWDNSYDDFVGEIRAHNKDYSVVPEFIISDHIENYILNTDGDFFSENKSILSIKGASSSNPQNSSEDDFYNIYSNSDFMKHFDLLRDDHKGFIEPSEIKLTCKAIKKFVPYDGFYPSELLTELYTRFSSSYLNNVEFAGAHASVGYRKARIRPFIAPLFAPGILCNTIKSGIAVDWPQYTGSYNVHRPPFNAAGTLSDYHLISTSSGGSLSGFDMRVPFEAVIEPEEYLANTDLVDMWPHPSCSINATASWGGGGDNLYKMKAHNALASMVEFFLPGPDNKGELATLVSSPESEWKPFKNGQLYGMRVKLRKSYNKTRRPGPGIAGPNSHVTQHDRLRDVSRGLEQTLTMCSRPSSFGPPICGRSGTFDPGPRHPTNGSSCTSSYDSLNGVNPAFTPPYYDGEAHADFIYLHTGSQQPTLDNIQTSGTLINWRFDPFNLSASAGGSNAHPYGPSNINNYSMQLSHSVNIFGKVSIPITETDAKGNLISTTNNSAQSSVAWAIQPKFECPVLNVHGASASMSVHGSESVPRSIWSQFATIPTGTTGLFLEVGAIDKLWMKNRVPIFNGTLGADSEGIGAVNYTYYYNLYGGANSRSVKSLADQIGFKNKTEKIGQLAKNRKVKEAIVAIPFLETEGKRRFFEIPKEDIDKALDSAAGERAPNTISDMVSKMQEYILPPKFDFVKNKDIIAPFAMYIFEFSHTFNQNDLSYIWQNIQPNSGRSIELSEASISHPLLTSHLMGAAVDQTGEPLQSQLRWMVFKIKQKAPTNYYEKLVRNQSLSGKAVSKLSIGRSSISETDIPEYSYNWPYDYFSLVEFAKIDAEVKFAPSTTGPSPEYEEGPVITTRERKAGSIKE